VRKLQPLLAALRHQREVGMTRVGVLATFFSYRIKPLKARVHPMHRNSDNNDLTWESLEEISRLEALACVGSIMDWAKTVATFAGHPLPFTEDFRPNHVQ
jgi:hypothetical protein